MSMSNAEINQNNAHMEEMNSNPANTIYVGNLDQRVTDTMLHEIFETIGPVVNVKIVNVRRHNSYAGVNYAFVEYTDPRYAEQAIQDMNGRKIFNFEIKVNWAQQSNTNKEDTSNHFHVFIGDLAPEITDEALVQAFSVFGSMSEAHVMWDAHTGKSRGFGFVAFRDKSDAEQAIATMNGEWLGSRAIRCNWATQKGQTATPAPQPGQQLPFEIVIQQTPSYVTSIYVGNLPPNVNQTELIQPFQRFGYIQEVKLQAERGFAFIKMDTHENAANAIVHLQNMLINGNPAKLSWGKDRPPQGWQNYGGYQQPQQNWNNSAQYRGRNHHLPPQQNLFRVAPPPQMTNGYGFHPNPAASLDPHSGSAISAAQWNQQAAIAAAQHQKQLYEQYSANPNNI
ncbi:uncharacterized protein BX663DRAFT_502050 [Cokeromyces recurvatus]|uniref:uncharacterized protein n=1 Tax=Cokeromyces recurvatus TaxID=90255 RepID=UPI00221FD8F0|nr:uncharacterized protein BX663DRAFT_502050 [Cokeromyces recurvatus]KAI7905184.1 hypothetical protein BX663DRAFT_502050 [Cokeromyces recurvatus]